MGSRDDDYSLASTDSEFTNAVSNPTKKTTTTKMTNAKAAKDNPQQYVKEILNKEKRMHASINASISNFGFCGGNTVPYAAKPFKAGEHQHVKNLADNNNTILLSRNIQIAQNHIIQTAAAAASENTALTFNNDELNAGRNSGLGNDAAVKKFDGTHFMIGSTSGGGYFTSFQEAANARDVDIDDITHPDFKMMRDLHDKLVSMGELPATRGGSAKLINGGYKINGVTASRSGHSNILKAVVTDHSGAVSYHNINAKTFFKHQFSYNIDAFGINQQIYDEHWVAKDHHTNTVVARDHELQHNSHIFGCLLEALDTYDGTLRPFIKARALANDKAYTGWSADHYLYSNSDEAKFMNNLTNITIEKVEEPISAPELGVVDSVEAGNARHDFVGSVQAMKEEYENVSLAILSPSKRKIVEKVYPSSTYVKKRKVCKAVVGGKPCTKEAGTNKKLFKGMCVVHKTQFDKAGVSVETPKKRKRNENDDSN